MACVVYHNSNSEYLCMRYVGDVRQLIEVYLHHYMCIISITVLDDILQFINLMLSNGDFFKWIFPQENKCIRSHIRDDNLKKHATHVIKERENNE